MLKQKLKKIPIGIIVDSIISTEAIHDYIEMSLKSNKYAVTHLIIQNTLKYKKTLLQKALHDVRRIGVKKLLSKVMFKILCKLEITVVRRIKRFNKFYNKYDLSKFHLKIVEVKPDVSKSGLVYRYNASDILKIKSLGLNLLIRGGNGILRGEILHTCINGVISFHHGDSDVNRGGPPGFWETKNKERRTGFVVQRLKDELDGGDVLFKGYVPTLWMYTLNYATLIKISNPFLHHVIDDITSDKPKLSVKEKKPYSFPLYVIPSILDQISYVFATLIILFKKIINKIFGRDFRWSVSYQFVENWKDVTLSRSKRIPNPPNRFLADPFVIKRGNSHFCFVEDYDYKKAIGCIKVYKITKDYCKEVGTALEETFHLSYPFLLEYDGNLYMCPETIGAQDIRLYKCVNFPLQWKYEKTLIPNVSACDTSIFFRDNKWYLITNISTSRIGHGSELHIFWSDNPLSDKWTPHSLNPVLFNSLISRNAGFISDMGKQYRVFQKQGFNLYGESLGISRIVKLTDSTYKEMCEFEVVPKFFDKIKGTHTYNFSDGLLVFDTAEISTLRNSN
jgi:hypothetical protein